MSPESRWVRPDKFGSFSLFRLLPPDPWTWTPADVAGSDRGENTWRGDHILKDEQGASHSTDSRLAGLYPKLSVEAKQRGGSWGRGPCLRRTTVSMVE